MLPSQLVLPWLTIRFVHRPMAMRVCWLRQVDGTADNPITIRGAPGTDREDVILKGDEDEVRVLEIFHSHYVIEVLSLFRFCGVPEGITTVEPSDRRGGFAIWSLRSLSRVQNNHCEVRSNLAGRTWSSVGYGFDHCVVTAVGARFPSIPYSLFATDAGQLWSTTPTVSIFFFSENIPRSTLHQSHIHSCPPPVESNSVTFWRY